MSAFLDCGSCAGFLAPSAERCPHCSEAVAPAAAPGKMGVLGKLATVAAGGLMSITLMACYGVALTPCENLVDADEDGYFTSEQTNCEIYDGRDCDDANANINPGAEDFEGDGIDYNCDGSDGNGGGGNGGGGNGGNGGNTGGSGGSGGSSTTSSSSTDTTGG